MNEVSRRFAVAALRRVVSLRRSPINGHYVDRPYIGLENVEPWTGRFMGDAAARGGDELRWSEGASQGNIFEPGDVLFGKLRPYLAKAWMADFPGRSTAEFLVMRPVEIEPRFLMYTLISRYFVDAADAATFGSRMPRAEWSDIGSLPVPLPSRRVQRAIAAYLDRETARIDALIAVKQRLVGLTVEKRRALVTRAVTCGLMDDMPLEDAGIPWLEKVPEHWEVWKIGHLGDIGNGSTPRRGDERFWTGGIIPWLNSGVVNKDEVVSSEQHVTHTAIHECHLPVLTPGTVLVAITGQGKTRGRACVLSIEATINQHLAFINPDPARLHAWFLRWWLFAAYAFLRGISDDAGGTKGALTCEDLANLRIPLPPLSEQDAIVKHIARENTRLERARVVASRTISLLKERRQALIAATVAGEIDVEEAP